MHWQPSRCRGAHRHLRKGPATLRLTALTCTLCLKLPRLGVGSGALAAFQMSRCSPASAQGACDAATYGLDWYALLEAPQDGSGFWCTGSLPDVEVLTGICARGLRCCDLRLALCALLEAPQAGSGFEISKNGQGGIPLIGRREGSCALEGHHLHNASSAFVLSWTLRPRTSVWLWTSDGKGHLAPLRLTDAFTAPRYSHRPRRTLGPFIYFKYSK